MRQQFIIGSKYDESMREWELIAAINSLRNELAHKLESPEREKKLRRVKELYFREAAGLEGIENIKNESDTTILCCACGHCGGFLAKFEADSKALRHMVHTMDRQINPDLRAFEL
ncbi:hypothetical protein [Pollutimonas nitritireducens]|nr:hypothetical protein [Pollutimonas nitritireducens]